MQDRIQTFKNEQWQAKLDIERSKREAPIQTDDSALGTLDSARKRESRFDIPEIDVEKSLDRDEEEGASLILADNDPKRTVLNTAGSEFL